MYLLIVTGMSGAGKSQALRKLEDSGFFCVDNLPIALVDELVNRLQPVLEGGKIALGIDSRNDSLDEAEKTIVALRARGITVYVLFIDATDEVLFRRYSETRRNYP